MGNKLQSNPVPVVVTAALAVLNSVLVVLQEFAVDLSAGQVAAIMGLGNTLGGLVAAIWAQRRTVPWTPDPEGQ